jgi:hypothetical protein
MTPRFLSLCKANKLSASLDTILDDSGEPFVSETARDRYICDFFQLIYTPAVGNVNLHDTCIEDFLGQDICNNPVVLESKLTVGEQETFDRPLSVQELDNALHRLNKKSAGGMDGIPTKFLKKFWAFLRYPLTNYANFSFNTGNLTQSFNSAGIRLIPKKGDITKIKKLASDLSA